MSRFKSKTSPTLVALSLMAGAGATASAQNAVTSPASPTATLANVNVYKDGTFAARGWYGSLPSSITVTVTLRDDQITGVKVTPHATDPTSLDLQRRFAAAVPQVVIGKRLSEVKVGKLAGSSGTPVGFNDAIDNIRRQAKRQ